MASVTVVVIIVGTVLLVLIVIVLSGFRSSLIFSFWRVRV